MHYSFDELIEIYVYSLSARQMGPSDSKRPSRQSTGDPAWIVFRMHSKLPIPGCVLLVDSPHRQ